MHLKFHIDGFLELIFFNLINFIAKCIDIYNIK